MHFQSPPPEAARLELGAMKRVAMANGNFDESERYLLGAVARVLDATEDLDALAVVEPAALAESLTDAALRRQCLHGLIVMSMIDGESSEDEAALVEGYAEALAFDEASLRDMRRLAAQQMLGLRFDLMRRVWSIEKFEEAYFEEGLTAFLRLLGQAVNLPEDADVAERFSSLEHYPSDSLGFAYHRYCAEHGFAMPGERRGPPEFVLRHDLTHVIGGYGTDPAGEVETAAFTAGYRREDPFAFLFFVLLQFHLGVRMMPLTKPTAGFFDRDKIELAVARGVRMRVDLSRDWDYWAVMSEPLAELRKLYDLSPLA